MCENCIEKGRWKKPESFQRGGTLPGRQPTREKGVLDGVRDIRMSRSENKLLNKSISILCI